jgi:hypothetical protein
MARLRVLLSLLALPVVHASLKDTVKAVKSAHDAAAAAARLKHLAEINAASAFVDDTAPASTLKTDVHVLASDAGTLQVYTVAGLPSDVPAACQTALTATVACNSTILDIGLVFARAIDLELTTVQR